MLTSDPTVNTVLEAFIRRSDEGMVKYGQSLRSNPSGLLQWINHAQEELMDAILYLERTKEEINAKSNSD